MLGVRIFICKRNLPSTLKFCTNFVTYNKTYVFKKSLIKVSMWVNSMQIPPPYHRNDDTKAGLILYAPSNTDDHNTPLKSQKT